MVVLECVKSKKCCSAAEPVQYQLEGERIHKFVLAMLLCFQFNSTFLFDDLQRCIELLGCD